MENNNNTSSHSKETEQVTNDVIQKNQSVEESNSENIQAENPKKDVEEKSSTPQKARKSKEEQLQLALEKKQALDIKIQRYQKELREKNQKNRNRGLILLGIVMEQNLKKKFKTTTKQRELDWWLGQHVLLPDKDKEVYMSFIRSLAEEKNADENNNESEQKSE